MNMQIPVHVDEFGRLVGIAVHDGHLKQFTFLDGTEVMIRIHATSGVDVDLRLHDVFAFGIVKFSHGAIVSDVFSWPLSEATHMSWDLEDSPWRVLYAAMEAEEDAKDLAGKLVSTHPGATLIQVLCSFGGSIAAVCNKLTVETQADN